MGPADRRARAADAHGARVVFLAGALLALAASPGPAATATRPVLIELFTSEGCSSCPNADALLAALLEKQPVPGVELVGLAFHVDYWDRLGWRDRFASPDNTERQKRYQEAFGGSAVYTPQAVVDGSAECVGGDPAALERLVAEARNSPKLAVGLDVTEAGGTAATARITVEPAPFPTAVADVWLALAESGLETDVARGENAGRRLSHAAVVRRLERVGTVESGRPFAATHRITPRREWRREALEAVVVVQERETGRVVGIASRPL
jgi:hypothetical protein